jgi:hypothetical protein
MRDKNSAFLFNTQDIFRQDTAWMAVLSLGAGAVECA